MVGAGFEPAKSETGDLQSPLVGRLSTPPSHLTIPQKERPIKGLSDTAYLIKFKFRTSRRHIWPHPLRTQRQPYLLPLHKWQ
jgi:hypothetical protein